MIQVTVGDLTWRRIRRYSEFHELHEQVRVRERTTNRLARWSPAVHPRRRAVVSPFQLRALNKYIPLPRIPPKVVRAVPSARGLQLVMVPDPPAVRWAVQWFGSKEPAFIHERCRQLDMYLRTLCACPVSFAGLGI